MKDDQIIICLNGFSVRNHESFAGVFSFLLAKLFCGGIESIGFWKINGNYGNIIRLHTAAARFSFWESDVSTQQPHCCKSNNTS